MCLRRFRRLALHGTMTASARALHRADERPIALAINHLRANADTNDGPEPDSASWSLEVNIERTIHEECEEVCNDEDEQSIPLTITTPVRFPGRECHPSEERA